MTTTAEMEDGRISVTCRREGEGVVHELPQIGRKQQTSTVPWQLPKVHIRGSSSLRRSHSTVQKRRPNQHRRYRLLKSTSSQQFNLTAHGKNNRPRKQLQRRTVLLPQPKRKHP